MTAMAAPTRIRQAAAALASVVILGACGGSANSAKANPDDLAVAVASYDLTAGHPTRFIAGLLTVDQRLLGYGSVDFRFSYVGTKEGANPSPQGPVTKATYLPIPGSTTPSPPPATPQIVLSSDTRGVYSTRTTFDKAGFWEVEASTTLDGKVRTGKGAFAVNPKNAIPDVGDPALPTQTLTPNTPDTPPVAIDSRAGSGPVPDPDLHRSTIAAALAAKRPIVAVFATPVYCTSRFCGPITDLINDLAHQYADKATFIHVEIWKDFQNSVVNQSAADWLQRDGDLNEPWVFLIGADGRIVARYDNVATREEIEPFLQGLPSIGAATP
ncbi:MAG: hypothetical protein M3066_21035 [Actinomycetota bacterium]|nr:hypothetical protein [Actinomycetota bacterium]